MQTPIQTFITHVTQQELNKFAQNSIYLSSQQATRYFGKLPLRVVMRFVFFRSKLRGIRPLAIDTIMFCSTT
ncbi:hypothetical protein [Piscirickettsia salmonis]|uniref:hypothetical protein n=1 Tax=Piscirickettsia salmonis TaxID=1238 RepID=UPI0012BAEA8F|nr:hypothetical protein [Piscirickettsia salmonis]